MKNFIVKFLAKKFVNKHKDDSVFMGLTDKTIRGYDFTSDMFLFGILWVIGLFVFIFGVPTLFYFLGWGWGTSIVTFIVTLLIGIITTIVVSYDIITKLYKEIVETLELIRKLK